MPIPWALPPSARSQGLSTFPVFLRPVQRTLGGGVGEVLPGFPPEVWLPLLPVLENPGALAVHWPALAYPTTDICQTAAVWEEGGMFT